MLSVLAERSAMDNILQSWLCLPLLSSRNQYRSHSDSGDNPNCAHCSQESHSKAVSPPQARHSNNLYNTIKAANEDNGMAHQKLENKVEMQ